MPVASHLQFLLSRKKIETVETNGRRSLGSRLTPGKASTDKVNVLVNEVNNLLTTVTHIENLAPGKTDSRLSPGHLDALIRQYKERAHYFLDNVYMGQFLGMFLSGKRIAAKQKTLHDILKALDPNSDQEESRQPARSAVTSEAGGDIQNQSGVPATTGDEQTAENEVSAEKNGAYSGYTDDPDCVPMNNESVNLSWQNNSFFDPRSAFQEHLTSVIDNKKRQKNPFEQGVGAAKAAGLKNLNGNNEPKKPEPIYENVMRAPDEDKLKTTMPQPPVPLNEETVIEDATQGGLGAAGSSTGQPDAVHRENPAALSVVTTDSDALDANTTPSRPASKYKEPTVSSGAASQEDMAAVWAQRNADFHRQLDAIMAGKGVVLPEPVDAILPQERADLQKPLDAIPAGAERRKVAAQRRKSAAQRRKAAVQTRKVFVKRRELLKSVRAVGTSAGGLNGPGRPKNQPNTDASFPRGTGSTLNGMRKTTQPRSSVSPAEVAGASNPGSGHSGVPGISTPRPDSGPLKNPVGPVHSPADTGSSAGSTAGAVSSAANPVQKKPGDAQKISWRFEAQRLLQAYANGFFLPQKAEGENWRTITEHVAAARRKRRAAEAAGVPAPIPDSSQAQDKRKESGVPGPQQKAEGDTWRTIMEHVEAARIKRRFAEAAAGGAAPIPYSSQAQDKRKLPGVPEGFVKKMVASVEAGDFGNNPIEYKRASPGS